MTDLLTGQAPGSKAGKHVLTDQLRAYTREIHAEAERSGVIARLLDGSIELTEYTLYLRNLAEVYRALEQKPHKPKHCEEDLRFALPAQVPRYPAICADLAAIASPAWASDFAVLPETKAYCERIMTLAETHNSVIVAHWYVRYLGDLYGGQILQRRLHQKLNLRNDQLSWYRFDPVISLQQYRARLREAINRFEGNTAKTHRMKDEAIWAFKQNIALSNAVRANAVAGTGFEPLR